MLEIEKRFKLTEYQFNKIKNLPLGWSVPYQLTDIVFSKTGNVDINIVGWIVRLREKNGNITIDYKSPLNKELTEWEEIDIQVNDFAKAMKFLLKIGLSAGLVIDRIRMDCIWDNFKLTLDDLKFIGYFLEIEIVDPNKDTNFILFSTHFDIDLGDSQPPYGKIMLKEMENNSNVYHEVSEYIKSKSKMALNN
jgi:predicted adenylyl cyclase CyaB